MIGYCDNGERDETMIRWWYVGRGRGHANKTFAFVNSLEVIGSIQGVDILLSMRDHRTSPGIGPDFANTSEILRTFADLLPAYTLVQQINDYTKYYTQPAHDTCSQPEHREPSKVGS
jgi:hypothetical protein